MKKLNLYLYFLCIAFAPAMASGSDYDVVCMVGAVEDSCSRLTEPSSCKNNPKCIWSATGGCSSCSIGKYVNSGSCQSCPTDRVTTPSGENNPYQYTSCPGATKISDCYYNCSDYCKDMTTQNGTWSLDESEYPPNTLGRKPIAAVHYNKSVTDCKCKLTCDNADDYCSDDGEKPNGYHVMGSYSYSSSKMKYTCEPNWQKYTSGTDTGFQYWDNTSQAAPPGWSTGYITKCGANRHFKPNTVGTTPQCGKEYGTCESDSQNCDADFLGGCDVAYNKLDKVTGNIVTTNAQLEWDGNETTDKWTVSSGKCTCQVDNVPIMGECKGRICPEIGQKTVVFSYTGNGRKGASNNTLWTNAQDTVTSCAAGYYANDDKTKCIPVEDGYYSPANDLERHACAEVLGPDSTYDYYKYSDSPRASAADCYVKCSERAGVLNDTYGDRLNDGKWRWNGQKDEKRYANSENYSCNDKLKLYCYMDYYVNGSGENSTCDLCANLTDEENAPGYWNKSKNLNADGAGSCYADCNDKKLTTSNGEFTAKDDQVSYDATTKPKCEYTLACNAGYYGAKDGQNCNKCPAGSTSNPEDANATITDCYMMGGSDGTEFCDSHGCFNLPAGVQISYVGN